MLTHSTPSPVHCPPVSPRSSAAQGHQISFPGRTFSARRTRTRRDSAHLKQTVCLLRPKKSGPPLSQPLLTVQPGSSRHSSLSHRKLDAVPTHCSNSAAKRQSTRTSRKHSKHLFRSPQLLIVHIYLDISTISLHTPAPFPNVHGAPGFSPKQPGLKAIRTEPSRKHWVCFPMNYG